MQSGNPTEAFKKSFEILGLHYADRAGMDVVMMRITGIGARCIHSMANLPQPPHARGGQGHRSPTSPVAEAGFRTRMIRATCAM